jgi:GH15 family glucan-1,4-alpha-glucosidase
MVLDQGSQALAIARIEDYALLGDTHSAGLVSRDGSIDWLCLPRFDSGSVFAAILDERTGGRWRIAPAGDFSSSRRYRKDTLVLETVFETASGSAVVIDCLPIEEHSDPAMPRQVFPHEVVVRIVRGLEGNVALSMLYEPRFDYGYVTPWFRKQDDGVEAVGGPDAFVLRGQVPLQIDDCSVTADFEVDEGQSVAFIAAYRPSHVKPETPVAPDDCDHLVEVTTEYWRRWAARCSHDGPWREEVMRSLLTLKALTYSPTGGIVAAPTTSLPEALGGVRNWDYRYCWLRDATFTLDVLLDHGFTAEAQEWRSWLLRAVAGEPEDLQIMYGVRGERRLLEHELDWLEGYEGASPVRAGNEAHDQFQLDVYGEVMDSFHSARRAGLETDDAAWALERNIVEFVCARWKEPDEGIWEVRSGREHFVHSKVMAWVAVDRGIKAVEHWGKEGPVARWREVRDLVRSEVLERGYNSERGTFVRAYGSSQLDAALLMLPLVGFLPAADDRMRRTIDAIAEELVSDGLVLRYHSSEASDGLPAGEGTFLMCTFWLADCFMLLGRLDEARAMLERLLGLSNDVGLLAEQYDTHAKRLVGNFPQAFSHTGLVTTAAALTANIDPATRMNRAR